jgi:hypothetical protein
MSEDEIKYLSGFGIKDVVAWGTTGLVVLDESSKTIIKTPLDSFDQERVHLILRKRQIYKRFAKRGGHKGILSYHRTFETGIRLEYAPNHNLHSFNKRHDVDFGQRLTQVELLAASVQDSVHRTDVRTHG